MNLLRDTTVSFQQNKMTILIVVKHFVTSYSTIDTVCICVTK